VVRIRLQRTGRKNRPFYRIQVLDKRTRRDGASIEQLGWFNPLEADPAKQIHLNEERVRYWIGVGAQPTVTVRNVLGRRNLINVEKWEAERALERKRVEAARAAAAAAPAEGEKKQAAKPEEKKADEKKPE
jgi:small subunit ribosomal protein S16